MLNLILLATLNSQNINHLFPGFLTTLPPGLFAQSGRESPEQVFPPLASSKPSKAAHQPRTVREIIIQPKASRLQLHGSSETYFWAMNGRKLAGFTKLLSWPSAVTISTYPSGTNPAVHSGHLLTAHTSYTLLERASYWRVFCALHLCTIGNSSHWTYLLLGTSPTLQFNLKLQSNLTYKQNFDSWNCSSL